VNVWYVFDFFIFKEDLCKEKLGSRIHRKRKEKEEMEILREEKSQ
jgi:hypothetical protein